VTPADITKERERLAALCELIESTALDLLRLQKELALLVAEWQARKDADDLGTKTARAQV
jgi:hypothetical protein